MITRADAPTLRALADLARATEPRRRAGHLAAKAEDLAARIEAPAVHPATDAAAKARILAAVQEVMGGEADPEHVYAVLLSLDKLGLLPECPRPAMVAYEDGRGQAEMEERYSHMDLGEP